MCFIVREMSPYLQNLCGNTCIFNLSLCSQLTITDVIVATRGSAVQGHIVKEMKKNTTLTLATCCPSGLFRYLYEFKETSAAFSQFFQRRSPSCSLCSILQKQYLEDHEVLILFTTSWSPLKTTEKLFIATVACDPLKQSCVCLTEVKCEHINI